jgi:hypothetical protein
MMYEIPLTPTSRLPPCIDERSEHQEIADAKVRTPASEAQVRIGRFAISPADGHGAERAVGMLEGDTLLTPERLAHHEPEALAPQRMKRMRDANPVLISGIGCI